MKLNLNCVLVFFVALLSRTIFCFFLSDKSYSIDFEFWQQIASSFRSGGNPYRENTYINWGPIWPFLIYFFDKVSFFTEVKFLYIVKSFLIIADSLLACTTYLLYSELFEKNSVVENVKSKNPSSIPIILLFCLHPVPILLSTLHLNFDSLVLLFFSVALIFFNHFLKLKDVFYFYIGVVVFSLSIATKTNSLLVAPAIFGFFYFHKILEFKQLIFGFSLLLLPLCFSLIAVYPLAPEDIYANIFTYSSIPSSLFGFSWLTRGGERVNYLSSRLHTVLFIAILVSFYFFVPKKFAKDNQFSLAKISFLSFLTILLFGTGISMHYFLWIWPFLPILWTQSRIKFQVALFATLATPIFIILYSGLDFLGGFYFRCPEVPSQAPLKYLSFCQLVGITEMLGGIMLTFVALCLYVSILKISE
jgi:hypothetical protein